MTQSPSFTDTLAQLAQLAQLADNGMAQLMGVPLTTYRGWRNGNRTKPDAAAARLAIVLVTMAQHAPEVFTSLVAEARLIAPERPKSKGGRPPGARNRAKLGSPLPTVAEAPSAPSSPAAVPDWLLGATAA